MCRHTNNMLLLNYYFKVEYYRMSYLVPELTEFYTVINCKYDFR